MAERVRTFDWSHTPLGPMERWPQSLRTAVSICLNSPLPMLVWWGPDLINIYNDAYGPVLGSKHPQALGMPARTIWTSIWQDISPGVERVVQRGEAVIEERVRFVTERNGSPEEAYFTYSHSPIIDESGRIGGLLQVCIEETGRMRDEEERTKADAERERLVRELETQRSRLIDVFDQAPSFMAILRGPQHVFEMANERYYEIVGTRDILGKPVRKALPEVEGQGFFERLDDVYSTGETFTGTELPVLLRRRSDGSIDRRFVNLVFQATRETDGSISGIFIHGVDVTDMVLAREALRRQAAIFENQNDGIIITDLEGRILDWNPACERMLGYSKQEVLGRTTAMFHRPEDAEALTRDALAAMEQDGVWRGEIVYVRKDGTQGVCESVVKPLTDGSGAVIGGVGVNRDITDRVRAEAARRLSEERYRLVNRATNDALWDWDLRTDELDWNESLERVYGHRLADVPRAITWWYEHIHPEDSERVVGGIHAVIDSGDQTVWQGEYRFLRSDGTYAEVFDRGYVHRNEQGQPVRMIGSMLDLTERKRAEAQLRQSEQRLRQMADTMPQMVWVTRPDGYHEYYNKRWYEFTGVPDGSTDGEGWNNMFHPDDQDKAWAQWRRSLATGEPYEIEYRLRRHDGVYRWTLGRAMPVRDEDGNITKWFGTCTDVHEQKLHREELARAKEDAERASEAKSEFLATLSHELRTPLTPVLLTVSLMESHPALPEELREDVAAIRQNVELESRLIGDLLDLTRITKGKLQLDEQKVDLHLIVRSAIDICQREASARLILDLGASRHVVLGDSTRLQQVFWNLISNAIKFTPPEGTITVRSSNAAGERIRVDVADTGQGIDPATMVKLFTAFEQGHTRVHRQTAGLGLGLAISKKLVEAHRGTISATSDGQNRGATFSVELPTVDNFAPTSLRQPSALPGVATKPLSVLLVEDHEPTLHVMKKLLRRLGHRVTGTMSLASATAAANQEHFDLIISDLGLPDGSGLDLMRQIRGQYEGQAIALTGYGMESDIATSREAGFREHLTKPVDLAALEAAIARVVGDTP